MLGTASNMMVGDNMMICYRKGMKGLRISLNAKMRSFFREKLKDLEMGLEHRMDDNVGLLSGGQRQALTLLMMVLSEPSLVLLDEHTAALDPKNAQIVLDLTSRFISEYGLTSMMITHNMSQAIKYGNRLLMMDRGEIILDVSGEEKRNLTVEKARREVPRDPTGGARERRADAQRRPVASRRSHPKPLNICCVVFPIEFPKTPLHFAHSSCHATPPAGVQSLFRTGRGTMSEQTITLQPVSFRGNRPTTMCRPSCPLTITKRDGRVVDFEPRASARGRTLLPRCGPTVGHAG